MPRPVIDACTSGSIDKYLCSCRMLSSGTTNKQKILHGHSQFSKKNITWSFPIQKKKPQKKSCTVYTTNKPRKPLQTVYGQLVIDYVFRGRNEKNPFTFLSAFILRLSYAQGVRIGFGYWRPAAHSAHSLIASLLWPLLLLLLVLLLLLRPSKGQPTDGQTSSEERVWRRRRRGGALGRDAASGGCMRRNSS